MRALVAEVDREWPKNRFWQTAQGHRRETFDDYPTVGKYVATAHFEPRVVGGVRREWPSNQPWIFPASWGEWYDPILATITMQALLRQKSKHYGGIGTADFRLIVFYNRAHHYNTPFVSVDVRSLGDLAKIANHTLSETTVPFTCVYLLDVPTREAFEVYPEVKPCE